MAGLKKKFEAHARGEGAIDFDPLGTDTPRLLEIPIRQIMPDPDQPRKDVGDIEDLKVSIAEHGIIQPCIVSPLSPERYQLIAGERRYTAAKAIGKETIPCIVRTIAEHKKLEIQLIENLHRKELSPVEEAMTFKRLIDEFRLSQRQLADRLGKSAAGINQTLRILSLPAVILENVQTSEHLTRSVLLEIAKLESVEEQLYVYERARRGALTVKAARDRKFDIIRPKVPPAKHKFRTNRSMVTIVFDNEYAGGEEIVNALKEAVKQAQRRFEVDP
jgi:ParB family chromosome partitioning protein